MPRRVLGPLVGIKPDPQSHHKCARLRHWQHTERDSQEPETGASPSPVSVFLSTLAQPIVDFFGVRFINRTHLILYPFRATAIGNRAFGVLNFLGLPSPQHAHLIVPFAFTDVFAAAVAPAWIAVTHFCR